MRALVRDAPGPPVQAGQVVPGHGLGRNALPRPSVFATVTSLARRDPGPLVLAGGSREADTVHRPRRSVLGAAPLRAARPGRVSGALEAEPVARAPAGFSASRARDPRPASAGTTARIFQGSARGSSAAAARAPRDRPPRRAAAAARSGHAAPERDPEFPGGSPRRTTARRGRRLPTGRAPGSRFLPLRLFEHRGHQRRDFLRSFACVEGLVGAIDRHLGGAAIADSPPQEQRQPPGVCPVEG